MARKIINNKYQGETGLSSRTKINDNFEELYSNIVPKVFDTIEALQAYALTNPTAYEGQQCSVKGDTSTIYVINNDKSLHDTSDYEELKNKPLFDNEACYLKFGFDGTIYDSSIAAKYLFWSSPTTDYCLYNPFSEGWNGIIPSIEGRTSVSLFDLPLDIFDVIGTIDDLYITITNKQLGKCKSPFSIETLDILYEIEYRDYSIVEFNNNSKINKSSVDGLDNKLSSIDTNIGNINTSLLPVLQPETTFDFTTYTYNLDNLTAVWEKDWLVLDVTIPPTWDIRNFKSIVEIDNKFVNVTPIFALPIYYSIPVLKLYIRDADGILSKYNNLGTIFIQFDLYKHSSDLFNEHISFNMLDVFGESIPNMMISGGSAAHDTSCRDAILAGIPDFTNDIFVSIVDIPGLEDIGIDPGDSRIFNYCVPYEYDIVAYPVVSNDPLDNHIADDLSNITNPNILFTTGHGYNHNVELNYFDSDTEFLNGLVLCGVVVTDFIFHPSTTGYDFDPITHKGLFHYSYGNGLEFVVDFAILYPNTVYNSSYLGLTPITLIPSVSYATCIIAAQLKLIKLGTKSTWHEVRMAARATASNNGVWDKYKGFGHINVNAAIAYIEANYTSQSIEIGKRYSQEKGYSNKLQYEHIYNNTPVPKRLIEEKLATKADLENDKVKSSQIPSNVLLSDGSVQMGTQVQSILSDQYLIDSHTNTSINIAGDLRSMFSIGNYIKAYGAGTDYYMTILTVTYYSVQNYTKLTFISQGTISYFFVVKISNIPTIYTPIHNQSIATKEFVENKTLLLTNSQTVASYDIQLSDAGKRIDMDWATYNNVNIMNDATVDFPIGTQIWIKQKGIGATSITTQNPVVLDTPIYYGLLGKSSIVRLVKDGVNQWSLDGDLFRGHFTVGQKYLGGTIIKINSDGMSGLISSYFEFENTYEYAIINYGITGVYTKDGYSNWRLPFITELDLLFQHSKPERDIIGDINGDGIVNQTDLDIIVQAGIDLIVNSNPEWNTKWFRGDVSPDGGIDSNDAGEVENIITNNQGSMYQYEKYLAYDISDINPTTSCKGYIAPVLTISEGVISQTPHVLTEILKTDIVGIRLVRNF